MCTRGLWITFLGEDFRPQAKTGPGLRPGAVQPRRLAAVRRRRNPPLIPAKAGINKTLVSKRDPQVARLPLRARRAHENRSEGTVFFCVYFS